MAETIWTFDRKVSGTVLIGLTGLIITFFSWVCGIERKVSVIEEKLNQLTSYQQNRDIRQDEDVDRIEDLMDRMLEKE